MLMMGCGGQNIPVVGGSPIGTFTSLSSGTSTNSNDVSYNTSGTAPSGAVGLFVWMAAGAGVTSTTGGVTDNAGLGYTWTNISPYFLTGVGIVHCSWTVFTSGLASGTLITRTDNITANKLGRLFYITGADTSSPIGTVSSGSTATDTAPTDSLTPTMANCALMSATAVAGIQSETYTEDGAWTQVNQNSFAGYGKMIMSHKNPASAALNTRLAGLSAGAHQWFAQTIEIKGL